MPAVLTLRYDDVDDDIHMYMYIFVCTYVRVCVNTYTCIYSYPRESGWERTTRFHGNFTPPIKFLSLSIFPVSLFIPLYYTLLQRVSSLRRSRAARSKPHVLFPSLSIFLTLSLSLSLSLSLFLFLLVLTHPLIVFPSRKKTIHCQYSRPRHPPTVKPTFSSFLFFNGATNTEGIRSLPFFFFPSRPPIMTLRSMIFYHTSWRELSGESGAS